jgi:hypothetical protein
VPPPDRRFLWWGLGIAAVATAIYVIAVFIL